MLSLAAGGPGYVAVGNGGPWYSLDGSDWTHAQAPPAPTEFFASQGFGAPEVSMRAIAVDGDRLVAWGTASRHTEDSGLVVPVTWASSDGRTWTNVLSPGGSAAMAAGPGGFVAADDATGQVVVRMSADGDAWEQVDALGPARSEDAGGQVSELGVSSIAASDAGFVAAGQVGPRASSGSSAHASRPMC